MHVVSTKILKVKKKIVNILTDGTAKIFQTLKKILSNEPFLRGF